MKETEFVAKNKEKWAKFARLNDEQASDPHLLSKQYVELTEDLAFAQTFYSKRGVRVYLNGLAQKVFMSLHKQKRDPIRKFFDVWLISLPLELYRSRKDLLFALSMFLIWGTLGAIVMLYYPDYAETILSSEYVGMTKDNIKNGDPMAVYRGQEAPEMFLNIAKNNVRVAMLCFVSGIFLTLGTHYFLGTNGIMVGVFQTFMATKGVLLTSFLAIWLHGAFEISSIIIACGAGFVIGNSWLFPGSFSRFESLQIGGRRGIKIFLSTIPFFILAAWIEGFVTRHYLVFPAWSKWTLILLSFAIVLFYYVIYPIIVARKYPELLNKEILPAFTKKNTIRIIEFRNIGQNILLGAQLFRTKFGALFQFNLLTTLPIMAVPIVFGMYKLLPEPNGYFSFEWQLMIRMISGVGFDNLYAFIAFTCWILALTNLCVSCFYFIYKDKIGTDYWSLFLKTSWKIALILIPAVWVASKLNFGLGFITVFTWPLAFAVISFILFKTWYKKDLTENFKTYLRSSYGGMILLTMLFMFILFFFAQPIALSFGSNDLLDVLASFVRRFASFFYDNTFSFEVLTRGLVYSIFVIAIFPLGIYFFFACFGSAVELNESIELQKDVDAIGTQSKSFETDLDYAE